MGRKIRLYSPLAPIPLAKKLKGKISRPWSKEQKDNGRVMGGGTEFDMELYYQRMGKRTDHTVRFTATMDVERDGTLIKGRMGAGPGTGMFVAIWLSAVGFFLFNALIILGSNDAPLMFRLMFLGVPTLIFLGGLAYLKYRRRNGPEDERKILAFLIEAVDAREDNG